MLVTDQLVQMRAAVCSAGPPLDLQVQGVVATVYHRARAEHWQNHKKLDRAVPVDVIVRRRPIQR